MSRLQNAHRIVRSAATTVDLVMDDWIAPFESLLAMPTPCVLTTYRKNGTAVPSPVWFRFYEGGLEVVIAEGDEARRSIAERYLGAVRGRRFVEQRGQQGVVLRMNPKNARTWDLTGILPP